MTSVETTEPIRVSVTVAVPIEQAWEVFTTGMPDWWPVRTHSRAADEDAVPERLVIETRVGGEIYEQTGGVRRHWARIHTWEPPRALGYTWAVVPGNPPTEVRVTFEEVDDGTLVEVAHGGWEAYAEREERMRTSYGGEGGWPSVLGAFATHVGTA
jgi:uncharacterized protein YndB with AHSA1/START domain